MNVFQQMLFDLEAVGWTAHKIAQRFTHEGFEYQWIQIERVRKGGRLVYPLDYLIADLHAKECSTRNPTVCTLRKGGLINGVE